MGEINREQIRDRLGNIDQIRDIIFGAQLREYDSRIDKIESNLALLQQEMRDRIDQTKTSCLTEIRTVMDNLDKKIKSLSLGYQNDHADLRQTVELVNKKFSNSIESLDHNLDAHTNSLHTNLSETREKVQEEIRTLRSQVFEELERRFSMMADTKIAKDDMAEILFELGLRIKGTEFAPELKEAAGNNVASDIRLLEASTISG
ncbi:MAG TPA: hypothetical protein DEG17_23415 [Cyanobacteria bacterium UBA11149]|nr:hypothetical protein [Cyanobacteria bacterium UBA11367]HBE57064.1 hypothetical protein [Cyanobacteria bacterium UBA11366]HBK65689.1 hypothetical protein [Cyanobacteria bacterium UBA11166]HBR72129.1 hypothetical protein [Cyanobacteria bacterium UBA11159]HBS72641.1 hypothetical protein [Cyanobacteria bacterium UBA11153]HBW91731.1 hypothetical protein [Cyanobacteria bacterium UBA11149]HCA97329.1 hypothetical protein [Cyanobacteria bacterium UBA9226]